MNTYKTNYKTVIRVTEQEDLNFILGTTDRDAAKAAILERLGILGILNEDGSQTFQQASKEVRAASYSSEYELMMDTYWTISKALITEESGNNVIGRFEMNVGKTLTNDNFKVILINIDFIK